MTFFCTFFSLPLKKISLENLKKRRKERKLIESTLVKGEVLNAMVRKCSRGIGDSNGGCLGWSDNEISSCFDYGFAVVGEFKSNEVKEG